MTPDDAMWKVRQATQGIPEITHVFSEHNREGEGVAVCACLADVSPDEQISGIRLHVVEASTEVELRQQIQQLLTNTRRSLKRNAP